MNDLKHQLKALSCRIALATATITKSKKELGFLRHRRLYWIDGKKNPTATKLENKISRAEKTKNRLSFDFYQLKTKMEAENKERSSWTVCSNNECDYIDPAGGAVCLSCGSPMQPYLAE